MANKLNKAKQQMKWDKLLFNLGGKIAIGQKTAPY